MFQHNLTYGAVTSLASTGAAAGTSNVNGSSYQISGVPGFKGARAIAILGTLTATQTTSLKWQGSNDNSTWADIGPSSSGQAADGDSNKLLISDIYRPGYAYIRPVLVRGTANAVLTAIVVELYNAGREPVTQDSTVSQYAVNAYSGAGTP